MATVCSLGIASPIPDPHLEGLALAEQTGSAALIAGGLYACAIATMAEASVADALDRYRAARSAAEASGAAMSGHLAAIGMLGCVARSSTVASEDLEDIIDSLTRGRNQGNVNGCWAVVEPAMALAWRHGDVLLARRLREALRRDIWGARWGHGRVARAVDAATTDAERREAAAAVANLSIFDLIDLTVGWLRAEVALSAAP
jgi:hypothetical protein